MPVSALNQPGASRCVLVAEDDREDAFLLLRALGKLAPDVKVVSALDGQEAIERLRQGGTKPNLILTDLKMPRVNGFELLSLVKNDPGLGSIPTVIFSSSNEESDLERANALGANAYHVKPSDYGEYMDVVKKLCAQYLAA